MIVASIALFVALGGSSYAAVTLARNSVGTAQLKRGAVTGVKVRNDALTGKQIKESTLGKVRTAALADQATQAGTATEATSAQQIGRVHYATSSASVSSPSAPTNVGAACPSGMFVIGGGAQVNPDTTAYVNDSNPAARTGWEASAFTIQTGQTATLTVTAICAPAASALP